MFSETGTAIFRLALAGFFLASVVCGQTQGQTGTAAPPANITNEQHRLPDGRIDYLEILNRKLSEGVTRENNAAVLLLQALGPKILDGTNSEDFLYHLGLLEFPFSEPVLVPASELASSDPVGYSEVRSRPWTRDEFPDWARWLESNREPLAIVREASLRPKFFQPMVIDDNRKGKTSSIRVMLADRPLVASSRAIKWVLISRAMCYIGQKDARAAIEDLQTMRLLVNRMSQPLTMVEMLTTIASDQIPFEGERRLLESGLLTPQQIEDYREFLLNNPLELDLRRTIEVGEKSMFLDNVQAIRLDGARVFSDLLFFEHPSGWLTSLDLSTVDWDVAAESAAIFDEISETLSEQDDRLRLEKLTVIEKRLKDEKKKLSDPAAVVAMIHNPEAQSRTIGKLLANAFAPASISMAAAEVRGRTFRELIDIAFALESYRLKTGRFPEQPGLLEPAFVPRLPIDRFTGGPLFYRPADNGYLLYSAGENRQDDGGEADDVRIIVDLEESVR
jgi:hypothetical protein